MNNDKPVLSRLQRCALRAVTVGVLLAVHAGARADGALPVQPATVAGEGVAAPLPADQAATMIATLQKQLAEQQALLHILQDNVAVSKPAVPAESAPAATVPVAAAVTVGGAVTSGVPAVPGAEQMGATAVPAAPVAAAVPADAVPPPVMPVAPVTVSGAVAPAPADETQMTTAQRQAYASGVSVWREIESSMTAQRSMGIELDPAWVMKGLQDMSAHQPLKMSRDAIDTVTVTLNELYMEKAREARERQQTVGRAWQSAFLKEKGAVRDAGSLYKVVEAGKGRRLTASDVVTLSVTGTLPDGTVFDASGQSGQTKTAKVGALMPAVAIGLQKIARGGHIKIGVPPEKGYGDAGLPPAIPGGATLIFDITVGEGS